jgi:hypothetical protein
LYVGFSEKLEFFTDEFDSFSMRTIDGHDIGFYFLFVVLVNQMDEIMDKGHFSRTRCPVKNEMGDFLGIVKGLQFLFDFRVDI